MASLRLGGAERVMTSLTASWADAGHHVTLVTLSNQSGDAYALHPHVRRVPLDLMLESQSFADAVRLNVRRIRALRRTMGDVRPDVLVSFHVELNVLASLACAGLGIPLVLSERVHPPAHPTSFPWDWLRRLTYPSAGAVVVQSEATRRWASGLVGERRIRVIPNPVNGAFIVPPAASGTERMRQILGVGRLVPQKGFDVLVRAFGEVAERHPGWTLVVVGEGPAEDELKALAAETAPPGSVSFVGRVTDPERYYRTSEIFVLSSRYEGFPNVLLEAMASGCAVIATDCPAGPSDIVRSGVDGVLVRPDDLHSLARALEQLMSDTTTRHRLGNRAREVATRFGPDRVMQLWGEAIALARE